ARGAAPRPPRRCRCAGAGPETTMGRRRVTVGPPIGCSADVDWADLSEHSRQESKRSGEDAEQPEEHDKAKWHTQQPEHDEDHDCILLNVDESVFVSDYT